MNPLDRHVIFSECLHLTFVFPSAVSPHTKQLLGERQGRQRSAVAKVMSDASCSIIFELYCTIFTVQVGNEKNQV